MNLTYDKGSAGPALPVAAWLALPLAPLAVVAVARALLSHEAFDRWIMQELGFVELTPLGILFPLFIVLLVPIRRLAGRFFTAEELAALDSEEEPE